MELTYSTPTRPKVLHVGAKAGQLPIPVRRMDLKPRGSQTDVIHTLFVLKILTISHYQMPGSPNMCLIAMHSGDSINLNWLARLAEISNHLKIACCWIWRWICPPPRQPSLSGKLNTITKSKLYHQSLNMNIPRPTRLKFRSSK